MPKTILKEILPIFLEKLDASRTSGMILLKTSVKLQFFTMIYWNPPQGHPPLEMFLSQIEGDTLRG